uniref:Candidate secreted effector n=1 Tax=Meloidogyne incognita TaxID=6306 RepID=A0A914MBZ9_MELIC
MEALPFLLLFTSSLIYLSNSIRKFNTWGSLHTKQPREPFKSTNFEHNTRTN